MYIGERVRGGDSSLVLTARHHLTGKHTVYNLEVYRAHTFRVKEEGLWVHNGCGEIIAEITAKYGDFDCVECAKEIVKRLKTEGINGQLIELNGGPRGLFSQTSLNKGINEGIISTNGKHVGVLVEGKAYDNIHKQEISLEGWLNDFEGLFGSKPAIKSITDF